MWDYYAKRWSIYIKDATVALISGMIFDKDVCNEAIDKLQSKWVISTEKDFQGKIEQDVLAHCRQLRDKYCQQFAAWTHR